MNRSIAWPVATASKEYQPVLPVARGPVSDAVIESLRREPGRVLRPSIAQLDVLDDDDVQLALTCCYELHYRSFRAVSDGWEWSPDLLALRAELENAFELRLFDEVGAPSRVPAHAVGTELSGLAANGDGPSLSGFMALQGTVDHMREFCVHRSEYQLKEADPHTWMLPRLGGRAKAAAVTIQYDEYGAGTASAMHSELFAGTMAALRLDPRYGAYRDLLPGSTLATGNLVTMFGLHRRWRAACLGHLALFEMTSVQPMKRYSSALQRLGFDDRARRFYDVHVVADAWHEQIAQDELVAGYVESESSAGGDILFGARALMEVERRMSTALLDAWRDENTALLGTFESIAA